MEEFTLSIKYLLDTKFDRDRSRIVLMIRSSLFEIYAIFVIHYCMVYVLYFS
jgi:hypothetical protein